MLVFCFILIFTMTFIKTQKPIQVRSIENKNWSQTENFTEKINTSTNHVKILENGEKLFNPNNVLSSDKNYKKSLDFIEEKKNQNQSDKIDLITPRFFHNRAQIDGGGKIFDSKDTLTKIQQNLFEIIGTDIPLTETFREKFSEKKAEYDKNDNRGEVQNQNKLPASIKNKSYTPDEKLKITEKDAVAVQYVDEKFHKSKLQPPQHFLQNMKNVSSKSHMNTVVEQTILKNDTGKNATSIDRRFQSDDTLPIEKQKTMISSESQHRSKETNKEQTKSSTGFKNFDLKPEESSIYSKQSEEAPYKNDTDSMSLLARFRKQVFNWQNKAPISTSIVGATGFRSNLQAHSTGANYNNNNEYSTLQLRAPETLPAYYDNNQKVTNYNYSPTRQPIKITQQPYPSQNFKPASPDQNQYLPDRPPPEFELFKRQDQDTNNQFFSPGTQTYPGQQPLKNNTFYYAPSPNYYYPSVSYQPSRLPIEELTTQIYPPLGVPPSQTYQVPSYQYGPPEPSQTYGLPEPSQTYGPPKPSQTYGPPPQPTELLPIQEQKPYVPQSYSRIVLSDEQCVMNRAVMAEALVEVVLSLRGQRSQLKNCALMFTSDFNVAVTSMIQSDQNSTTVDLARQLNLRMFSVQPKGYISEIKFPWYSDDKAPGLTFGSSGKVIITFQSSTSITFRLLLFSYKDIASRIPAVFSYVLESNATTPLNESFMEFPIPEEKSEEKMPTEQEDSVPFNNMQPQLSEDLAPE